MQNEKTPVLFMKYAVPQMIGLLFNSIYLIVDGIFIGNRLGTDAMAAAAVSVPLIELLIALSIAISSGTGVIVSGQLARQEKERAVQTFNISIAFALIISLLIMLLGNLFIHPLARLLGSTDSIHALAIDYMRYILTYSPFLIFSFLLSGLI